MRVSTKIWIVVAIPFVLAAIIMFAKAVIHISVETDLLEASEPNFTETTIAEPNEAEITITYAEYDIVIQEPNCLVLEFWDKAGWYINRDEDYVITTRRRVTINQPYTIEVNEPRNLLIKYRVSPKGE